MALNLPVTFNRTSKNIDAWDPPSRDSNAFGLLGGLGSRMLKSFPVDFGCKPLSKQSNLSGSELAEGAVLKGCFVNINKILDLKGWLDNAM